MGVCRVFATRYVTALYLGYDTYNHWNTINLNKQDAEVTDRWEYLSQAPVLAVLHILGIMLFRYFLPFMSMASKSQTVRAYRSYVLRDLDHCQELQRSTKKRKAFLGHASNGLRWPVDLVVSDDSGIKVYIPKIANKAARDIVCKERKNISTDIAEPHQLCMLHRLQSEFGHQ